MKLGGILRKLREEKNLSQVQLANILNITSQSLSQYELNKRTPDIEMIGKLANYFDVSTDYLLGRTNIKKPYNTDNIDTYLIELKEKANERNINLDKYSPDEILDFCELILKLHENKK